MSTALSEASVEATPRSAGPAGLDLEPEQRLVYVDGESLELTYLEFELLAHLVEHPLRVHTRAQLLHVVWGWSTPLGSRTVDTHVARLRGKLGRFRGSIETVHRVGYRYRPSSVGRPAGQRSGSAA
jgi:DNA-binding response OmpR family regulator